MALSFTVRVPVRLPRMVGVKVTEIVQLAPTASVFGVSGHVEVCAKSPEAEIEVMVRAFVPVFFSVTVFAGLVVLSIWLAKVRLLGDKLTGRTPVPVNEAVWGEVEALSVTVRVPLRLPETVGVKVTEIVQVAPAARVLGDKGQLEVSAKSPEAAILVMVRATLWLFFSVRVLAAVRQS